MKINVITKCREFVSLIVSSDEMVENLKALLEVEMGVPQFLIELVHDGREMRNGNTLTDLGVRDGDSIFIQQQPFGYNCEWEKGVPENIAAGRQYNTGKFATAMLYIDMKVNDVPVKALIDTAAQITVISKVTAQRSGILRLLDTSFRRTVHGVGTSELLGKIHFAPLRIGRLVCPCSFYVMDSDKMDVILGLNILLKHQCVIDLKGNVLRVGDGSIVPFLPEKDIPSHFFGGQATRGRVSSALVATV